MFSLTDVLIDALWVLGLAGLLATFSYMDWYRGLQVWRWRQTWSRPCLLAPLSLSLALFSLGLALNGYMAYQPDPWWQTALWAVMAFLFAGQSFLYGLAGSRQGWSIPVDRSVPSATAGQKGVGNGSHER
jgi:hypothetical protein